MKEEKLVNERMNMKIRDYEWVGAFLAVMYFCILILYGKDIV